MDATPIFDPPDLPEVYDRNLRPALVQRIAKEVFERYLEPTLETFARSITPDGITMVDADRLAYRFSVGKREVVANILRHDDRVGVGINVDGCEIPWMFNLNETPESVKDALDKYLGSAFSTLRRYNRG